MSYTWNAFPYISIRGLLGAALIGGMLWIAMKLAGSADRYWRTVSFGIFWYLMH